MDITHNFKCVQRNLNQQPSSYWQMHLTTEPQVPHSIGYICRLRNAWILDGQERGGQRLLDLPDTHWCSQGFSAPCRVWSEAEEQCSWSVGSVSVTYRHSDCTATWCSHPPVHNRIEIKHWLNMCHQQHLQ